MSDIHSREFLITVLKAIWMDNRPDEVLALWQTRLRSGGTFPERALMCLEHTLENPPLDLVALLNEHGYIFLDHEDKPNEPEFTPEEYIEWLREQVALLRIAAAIHSRQCSGTGNNGPV